MRRVTLFWAVALISIVTAAAQNYVVVDSEKVFRSIDAYNQALEALDKIAEDYQGEVDAKFEQVEKLYQNYVARKASLSQDSRQSYEDAIFKAEAQAVEFQESIFSEQGELFNKRIEMIAPIQQKVFEVIDSYATSNGFDMVMDLASNPTMLYLSPKIDRTEAVIELLKK